MIKFRSACALAMGALLLFGASRARALDLDDVKDATEGACNWLIEQYDPSAKVFGKGPEAGELKQVAMVLAALGDSPNDYKETNGPFISEPVKVLVLGLREELKKGANANEETLKWGGIALLCLKNQKYKDLTEAVEQTQPMIKRDAQAAIQKFAASLGSVSADRKFLDDAFTNLVVVSKSATGKELEVDGKKIPWVSAMAEKIIKLQKEDGSFSSDIRANALALLILDFCYNNMK